MKQHICVETKRNVNASSLNKVVIDLCLTVWLFDCVPRLLMCFHVHLRMMVMTCDQGWFVPAMIFVMLSGLGKKMRVDSRFLSITVEGWWKQENQIILWDVKWDVLLVGWGTFYSPPSSAIRSIITVPLYHMWLFGLLLSSITEETIWGNNGPCSFPRQSIFCYFSRRFNVILHFGDKNSNF